VGSSPDSSSPVDPALGLASTVDAPATAGGLACGPIDTSTIRVTTMAAAAARQQHTTMTRTLTLVTKTSAGSIR
jgi:hypothetical protein